MEFSLNCGSRLEKECTRTYNHASHSSKWRTNAETQISTEAQTMVNKWRAQTAVSKPYLNIH